MKQNDLINGYSSSADNNATRNAFMVGQVNGNGFGAKLSAVEVSDRSLNFFFEV